jgi:hypothetical protein
MLFLWTITKRGKIWIDGDAFRQIVSKRLPDGFSCQEISFVGDQNLLNIYITLPERDDPQKRLALMDKFEELFRPTGIAINIHWTRRAPEEYSVKLPIWKKPVFWAIVAGAITGIANLGLRGILWVAGATAAGYLISWLFLCEEGNKLIEKIVKDIKDFRR